MPTRAAITSIAIANMMVWLSPSMMTGIASGSFTRHRSWPRVQPKQVAASTTSAGTLRSACSEYRTAGTTRVGHDREQGGELADLEDHHEAE